MKYTIGQLAEIIDGDRGKNYPQQHEFLEEGYCLFLNTGNVTATGFSFDSNQYISKEKCDSLRKGKLQRRDIVYTTRGTVGNAAFYADSVPYEHVRINSGMVIIRPNEDVVCTEFLYQILKSDYYRPYFKKYCTGSAQPQLPIKNFSTIELDLPDLETQQKIADMLSTYDDLIKNNQKQIKLLEEAAQRLYKEWFVDLRFPGHETIPTTDGIPEGWVRYKFSEIASIMSGGTPKTDVKEYYDGNIPFYTPKDSDGSFFAFDTITHISKSGLDHCNSQYYPSGTVIITARGTVGKTTILAVPMAMNQSCYALKCDELNSPYYLFFSLNKEVAALKTMANGGVFNTIIVKTFDSIHLTMPTHEVLAAFDAAISPIMDQVKVKMQQNVRLAEARDRLLPKLMNGEIEV